MRQYREKGREGEETRTERLDGSSGGACKAHMRAQELLVLLSRVSVSTPNADLVDVSQQDNYRAS
jgi:hypothetical protein